MLADKDERMGYAAAEESFEAQAIVLAKLIPRFARLEPGPNLRHKCRQSCCTTLTFLTIWFSVVSLNVGPACAGLLFDIRFREAAVTACELLSYCND